MIAHVVLFRPKSTLTGTERQSLVRALEEALQTIPSITRARVGRRRTLGRMYDAHNPHDFPFAAILEFESDADLLAYLEHPAHHSLGEQFYLTSESALALDFELFDGDRVRELLP